VRQHPAANHPPELIFIPGAIGHKLLEALGGHAQAGRHGLDGLALAGHEQALHVAGGRRASFAAAQERNQRDHESLKALNTASPLLGIPLHACRVSATFSPFANM
jgi:hypothetical protein